MFSFSWIGDYLPELLSGVFVTLQLVVVGAVAGCALGLFCAWDRTWGPRPLRPLVNAYVELVRNTPFLLQLFFIFFGLPSLDVSISPMGAAYTTMILNVGAYSSEIFRAGIVATERGQMEAGLSLGMSRWEVFRHVVLRPAIGRVWPALTSQIVIVMLGSAVVSAIAVEDISYVTAFIQSRNFRSFETYFVSTAIYMAFALLLRTALLRAGRALFRGDVRA